MLLPDSYTYTADSNGWLDIIQEIEDHVQNTSSKFDVKNTNDDTGGSGQYGITLTPSGSEGWDLALFYDGGSLGGGGIEAFIDPDGQITNPLDQSSGSSKTSPQQTIMRSQSSPVDHIDQIGISETVNTFQFFVLSSNGIEADWRSEAGRILNPVYADDASFSMGLGMVGAGGDRKVGFGADKFRTGESSWVDGTQVESENLDFSAFSNGRVRPFPIGVKDENNGQMMGMLRTTYHWQNGVPGLTRVDDADGQGGLLTLGNSTDQNYAILWDPSTVPTW